MPPAFSDTSSSGGPSPSWNRRTIASRPLRETPPWRNGASIWNRVAEVRCRIRPISRNWVNTSASLADVEQFVDQLVEASELARTTRDARAVTGGLRGVVADLLQASQRGEHEAASLHPLGCLRVGEELVDDGLVHRRLLAGERSPHATFSILSGSSGRSVLSAFVRRSTNGA